MNETLRKEEGLTTADLASGGAKMVREERAAPLFAENEAHDLRPRGEGIKADFVDEPRRAVEQADELVATSIKRLTEVFAEERSKLEQQWGRGADVSTEDLRVTLQRYRSFFTRI